MRNQRFIQAGVLGLTACIMVAPASAELRVSLGVRETAVSGGPAGAIGSNAGTNGGIEFLDRDEQIIPFDGQWHPYTWKMSEADVMGFAGVTANSILEGNYGSIENLRFRNQPGINTPITLWIDYVVNNLDSGPVVVSDFEGYADGEEVIFQEPGFSGSTTAFVLPGSTAGVDSSTAYNGNASYRLQWTFVDSDPNGWVRLTTFDTANLPNPLIRFDAGSEVTMYIKAVPEPATAMLLSSGLLLIARRRKKAVQVC